VIFLGRFLPLIFVSSQVDDYRTSILALFSMFCGVGVALFFFDANFPFQNDRENFIAEAFRRDALFRPGSAQDATTPFFFYADFVFVTPTFTSSPRIFPPPTRTG